MDGAAAERVVVEQQHGLLGRLGVVEGDEPIPLRTGMPQDRQPPCQRVDYTVNDACILPEVKIRPRCAAWSATRKDRHEPIAWQTIQCATASGGRHGVLCWSVGHHATHWRELHDIHLASQGLQAPDRG